MTDAAVAILTTFVVLAIFSGVAVYAYGRLAPRAKGEPSRALAVGADETAFDRIMSSLLDRYNGKSGLLLSSDDHHAFSVRAISARTAERSLDLQYYYWRDDLTGTLLTSEVLKAADRGVRVRLLLDDINLRGRDAKYLALDAHPNIEVRVFNPCWNRIGALQRGVEALLRASSATRRMHNKSWIADGRLAIVGGRNIGDAYFGASDTTTFRDLDLVVVGPAVNQGEAIFDGFWNSDCVLPIASLPDFQHGDLAALRKHCEALASSKVAASCRHLRVGYTIEALLSEGRSFHWVDRVQIVSDPPAKSNVRERNRWLYRAIVPLVTSAKGRLEITSPYFIPGEKGLRQLVELASRGVAVTVLTNSLAATDVAAVHGAYARYRKRLIRGGISLYELKPGPRKHRMSLFGSSSASLHTKAFTVDGHIGFVGSFNFDARSVSLNTEMGVIFDEKELAEELSVVFDEQTRPDASYRVTIEDGRLAWVDSDDREVEVLRSEPAGIWRRVTAKLVGLLPVESQL